MNGNWRHNADGLEDEKPREAQFTKICCRGFTVQLKLIFAIAIAIGVTLFALQNITPVTVSLAIWSFQGSLAVILLIALGFGALMAGLISSPTLIRSQWSNRRLSRRLSELEGVLAERDARISNLNTTLAAAHAQNLGTAAVETSTTQIGRLQP